MHFLCYPEKDSWIYSKYPTVNYGLDEVLEITKELYSSTTYVSRIAIQFDLSNFSTHSLVSASAYYLNLYACNPTNIVSDYTLIAYPISSSWSNGTGYPSSFEDKTDGISWTNKTETVNWNESGSDYITSSVSASQTFDYKTVDVRMDVTNIVRAWVSGTIQNNGFIIKRIDSQENSSSGDYGRLTYYSMDTHTVNLPVLEAVWDDSIYITGSSQLVYSGSVQGQLTNGTIYGTYNSGSGNISGSITGSVSGSNISGSVTASFYSSNISNFTATVSGSNTIITGSFVNTLQGVTFQSIASDEISIVMRNLKKEYKYATNAKIRLRAKDLYQRKTFLNTAATEFSIIKYLPVNNSWYSIKDAYTGRTIIPFSDYTKISCDLDGNYFNLNLNGFMPERFYRIIFKITMNGSDSYFDNNYIFKVIK